MGLRRSRRVLAALLLGVLSLAWGADAVHRAWTPHVRCAVDGAVAHAEHADHGHGARPDAGADEAPAGPAVAPDDGAAGHEHCGLPELGLATTLDLFLEPLPRPPLVGLRAVLSPGARAHEAIPRIFLAPKQSPPRAV